MKLSTILIILAVIFFCYIIGRNGSGKPSVPIVGVRSKIDGRTYYVQDKADKQQAADTLCQVRKKMIALVECLKRTKGVCDAQGRPDAHELKLCGDYESRINRLIKRFNPDKIAEGNEDVRYTTYTLNKGEKMVFCLRARGEDDRVHDLGMMTFVAIHEMAHVTSVTEHHTPEFNANFKWLLKNAVKCGIYEPEDFNRRPRKYCGINVTDSPV